MADAVPPRNSLICPVACVRFDKPCCAIAADVLPSPKMELITALVSFAVCAALANPKALFCSNNLLVSALDSVVLALANAAFWLANRCVSALDCWTVRLGVCNAPIVLPKASVVAVPDQ